MPDTIDTVPIDKIITGDCIETLASLPPESVDMVFADPPYNLQLRNELHRPNMTLVDAVTDEWDQFSGFGEYDRFTRAWMSACRRVLKKDGTLWVIGSYHNIYRVGAILQDLGYWFLNDVIWVKTNPMPNFRGVRLTNAHETLIWAAKSEKSRHTFNHHAAKAFNDGKQLRSDWTLPLCTGSERLRVDGRKVHSTQKPEALLERVLVISTRPGDIVLDPFFGSGTTGAVAKRLHRRWIGIEQEPEYVEAARRRIADVVPEMLSEVRGDADERRRARPRVPLSALLAHGLLREGQMLYFKRDRAKAACITAAGRLAADGAEGSIHAIGRRFTNGSPCNGWEHWYYEADDGGLRVIDDLRRVVTGGAPANNSDLATGESSPPERLGLFPPG